MSAARITHRYGAPFVAACGLEGAHTVAPDEARVTCPDCKALPDDPGAWAERDQLAALLRDVQQAMRDVTP